VFTTYHGKITKLGGPLDEDSVRVYLSRVRQHLAWLADALADGVLDVDPLTDSAGRDWAAGRSR
jgi:hypothetical protein